MDIDAVQQSAQKHGIDPSILAGLIETESSWNPNAISPSVLWGWVNLWKVLQVTWV